MKARAHDIVRHLVARGRLDELAVFELGRALERGGQDPRISLLHHVDMSTADFVDAQIALDGGDGWTCPGYRLEQRLGSGCSGTVYRALGADGPVALKVLHDHLLRDPEALQRLVREVEIARGLDHPQLPRYGPLGWARSSVPFVEMQLLRGVCCRGIVDFGEQLAWRVLGQLGELFGYLSARGIVHRDVKPANMMLVEGQVILCDLGVASAVGAEAITLEGEVVGTPRYMAPEQIRGEALSTAADIYSLGASVYELVVGAPLFSSWDVEDMLRSHLDRAPRHPFERGCSSISSELSDVLMWMLRKSPAARPTPRDLVLLAGNKV